MLDVKNLPFTDHYRRIRDAIYYRKISKRLNKTSFGFSYFGDQFDNGEDDIRIFSSLFKSNRVFIDVGANIGFYSLFANTSGLKVVAFEPDVRNFKLIEKSVSYNKLNVVAYNVALGERNGTTKIYGGRQGASLIKGWGAINSNYYNVCELNRLDDVLNGVFVSEDILFKLDAEGYEYPILLGALDFLKSENNITLYVEHGFHENFGADVNPNFVQLFELMFGLNYKCYTSELFTEQITLEEVREWVNLGKRNKEILNYLFRK
jgi:FkbM family methyltransferase